MQSNNKFDTRPDDNDILLPLTKPAPSSPGLPVPPPRAASTNQAKLEEFNARPKQPKMKTSDAAPVRRESDEPEESAGITITEGIKPSASRSISNSVNKTFGNISVTGGLLTALAILVIMIWMLIPTHSGYTRFQLLWFTLFGKTKLTTSPDVQSSVPVPSSQPQQPSNPVQQSSAIPVNQSSGPPTPVDMSGIDFTALEY